MRFEWVAAHAFGPLRDQRLELAPGMNVLHGPNEAGKSTWHAALYAGLCGQRRGRGAGGREERAFAERRRPWDGGAWEVSALVVLEDGRRVELRHDLAGRVDCRATDADLGRDYSAEIIHDGAPDGSRWLGLDRRAFLATACVRQADLLGVLDDPALLQEHLQRAAASSGADATAAAALERLERFQREQVGSERSNSARPLRQALERAEAALDAVERARRERQAYLELLERAEELASRAAEAERQTQLAEARAARAEAQRWTERLESERDRERPRPTHASMPSLTLAGAAAALVGLGLLMAGQTALGLVLLLSGMGMLGWSLRGFFKGKTAAHGPAQPDQRLVVLEAEVIRRRQHADRLSAGLDPTVLATVLLEEDVQAQLARLRAEAQRAATARDQARGQAEERARLLPSLAEAEEELAAAEAELARLRQLDRTLSLTRQFLERAQEQVHRDIAPVLRQAVFRWLPEITDGRYRDARVDPLSLEVQVCDGQGRWRSARLLSHGTAEQVYLLLRVAMAQHLTRPGEVCPLLLDDVTVQFDAERTRAVLHALHALSRERQVILFTQEDEVLAWAEANLQAPRDRVSPLPAPVPGAAAHP